MSPQDETDGDHAVGLDVACQSTRGSLLQLVWHYYYIPVVLPLEFRPPHSEPLGYVMQLLVSRPLPRVYAAVLLLSTGYQRIPS